MKIALAQDSFTQMGGAERVVDAFHELFPDAPVFTLVFDPKFKNKYQGWDIRTSQLQTLYASLGKLQYLMPLIPWAVDALDFSGYDLVLSSSSGFVKNIRVPKGCTHIDYCHTPTRFLWSEPGYVKQEVPFWLRPAAKILLKRMKAWDLRGAARVTEFIANSQEVQKRIKQYYKRDSKVIYPFVDTNFWRPAKEKQNYFLLAGRLQAHKNNELIIRIFNNIGKLLHVVGVGRQETYLKSIAKPNISFLGNADDSRLRDEYSGALGYIYPQLEDLGLMPLEAAACGTATLAYGHGGALETIIPGTTGELFYNYDTEQIKKLILAWNPSSYKIDSLSQQVKKFDKPIFKEKIQEIIKSYIKL